MQSSTRVICNFTNGHDISCKWFYPTDRRALHSHIHNMIFDKIDDLVSINIRDDEKLYYRDEMVYTCGSDDHKEYISPKYQDWFELARAAERAI